MFKWLKGQKLGLQFYHKDFDIVLKTEYIIKSKTWVKSWEHSGIILVRNAWWTTVGIPSEADRRAVPNRVLRANNV